MRTDNDNPNKHRSHHVHVCVCSVEDIVTGWHNICLQLICRLAPFYLLIAILNLYCAAMVLMGNVFTRLEYSPA